MEFADDHLATAALNYGSYWTGTDSDFEEGERDDNFSDTEEDEAIEEGNPNNNALALAGDEDADSDTASTEADDMQVDMDCSFPSSAVSSTSPN